MNFIEATHYSFIAYDGIVDDVYYIEVLVSSWTLPGAPHSQNWVKC